MGRHNPTTGSARDAVVERGRAATYPIEDHPGDVRTATSIERA